MTDEPLSLLALEADDLDVLSTHVQDAVLKPNDIAWHKREARFVLLLRRFDWAAPRHQPRRRLAALHFDRVLRVFHQNLDLSSGPLSLLAVTFEEIDRPSGAIVFVFSGGGRIRVEVECIEGQLKDLGPVWETAHRPKHPIEGDR